MNGRPRCRRQTAYLEPSIRAAACGRARRRREDWQRRRCWSLQEPGSGKTNTLAHRVAHLIVQGADPRRILLMTFSRRAASEMTKRVERIARKVMGDNAGS